MEYGMYMEYCVGPTYVTSRDMECTQSIVWYLYMCNHGIWNVHRVLCGTYICDSMAYGMYKAIYL